MQELRANGVLDINEQNDTNHSHTHTCTNIMIHIQDCEHCKRKLRTLITSQMNAYSSTTPQKKRIAVPVHQQRQQQQKPTIFQNIKMIDKKLILYILIAILIFLILGLFFEFSFTMSTLKNRSLSTNG